MKKLILTLAFAVGAVTAFACTNFIVTKGASTDGSVMVTYAADSHQLYGALYKHNGGKQKAKMLAVNEWDTGRYLGLIEQVPTTYSTVSNMNEHSLIITETTYGGRAELHNPEGLIDYGSLIYITLQRAKNAREAIKQMAEFVETYGYYSSGESFSISDGNEVWIMELIGKGAPVYNKKGKVDKRWTKGAVWVAMRVPDGYISGHANHARITTFPQEVKGSFKSISSKKMKEKFKLTNLERSWILYDIGNSAFILMVSTLIPIYFNSLAASAGVNEDLYLSYWGYAGSISTILVAFIAPICGTLSDRKFKKPIFLLTVLLGCIACAALGITTHWLWFLGIFVLAKVGFHSSLVFYDSMLPEITTDKRMDNVSSMGYAFGYIGSVIPFVACLVLVLFCDSFGMTAGTAMVIAFLITAVWWIVCSLPLARRYRQTAYVEGQDRAVTASFKRLAQTFREAKQHKHIFLYQVAFFFFIDGVYTIIDLATAYGKSLGLDTTGLLLALLLTQIVAFPCAIIFGRLSAKHDTGLLIKICIVCYTCITAFGMFLVSLWQFWMLATLVGMFQGGIQALSRSYLGKIIPPERSGEFYGLMDIFGKGASFVGTTMVALVSQLTDGLEFSFLGLTVVNTGIAVGSLALLFVIGFSLFCVADKLCKAQKA